MENFSKIACKAFAKHLQSICKNFCLTSFTILAFGYGYAQTPQEKAKAEYEKKVTAELSKYELKGLKTSLLLNKGIFTEDEIEFYRHLPRNAKKQVEVPTSADEWQSLYERLVGADLPANTDLQSVLHHLAFATRTLAKATD